MTRPLAVSAPKLAICTNSVSKGLKLVPEMAIQSLTCQLTPAVVLPMTSLATVIELADCEGTLTLWPAS